MASQENSESKHISTTLISDVSSTDSAKEPKRKISKKFVVTSIVGGTFLLLLAICLATLFFTKPTVEIGFNLMKPETMTIEPQLNATAAYPMLRFVKPQVITINGQQKGILSEYQIKSEDLKEGKNEITLQGWNDYNLIKTRSAEKNVYTISVDRVKPVLTTSVKPAQFYQLQKELKLKLQSEDKAKIVVNTEEKATFSGIEQEITLPLKDGINDFEIQTVDTFGNVSDPLKLQVGALVGDNWETYECGGLRLAIDKSTLQRGYTGIRDPRQNTPDARAYIATTQNGVCDLNKDGFGLILNPTGTQLYCFNCGGESNLRYIRLGKASDNYLKDLDLVDYGRYQKRKEEMTTRSGIKGELLYYELPSQEFPGFTLGPRSVYVFVFKHQGNNVYFRIDFGKSIAADAERDFQSVVKNFVIA